MTNKMTLDIETYVTPGHPWPFTTEKVVVAEAAINPSIAEQARNDGINLLYNFDAENTSAGGYTIAYRPVLNYSGRNPGKMVDVAVSYCSAGDIFSKKLGRECAINNFYAGKVITVPALMYGEDEIHAILRDMFSMI
jgi:hypothetical protein